ncbi:MAG TPA: glycosyltransferase family 4 protein [Thermoplasmata archaeon]
MEIHHVTPHFNPDIGGVEAHVLRLSQFLVSQGHVVVVHTSRRSYRGERLPEAGEVGGIRVRRYTPVVRLGYYTTLFRPQIDRADVVHLHGYGHASNDWTARHVRGRTPAMLSLHHGVAQPPPNAVARMKRGVYDPIIGVKTLRLMESLVAASEPDRRWLVARDLPQDRIHVIPSGLDDAAFEPGDGERARRLLGVERYILYLGRLHREKSVDHLLRAARLVRDSSVAAIIAGPDGGARPGLESLVASLGLPRRVRFLGEVDEPMKRDLLAGCECLVLPSFYEAQGIVILEAWAQGRPVIASRVGGIPFLVHDRQDGFLYPWGDIAALGGRLEWILANPTKAGEMGRAGERRAREGYRWAQLAPLLEQLYERLALGKKPATIK